MTIGVVPIAVGIGVALSSSEMTTVQAIVSGPMILAGASQLAAVRLMQAEVATQVVVLSALMLNARILIYSAAFAPWFGGERLRVRMLLAIPVIDQLYFVCVPRFGQGDLDRRGRIAFFAGAAVWLYGPWWATQLAAYGLGTRLVAAPDALGVLAPLALVGLLARSTAGRPAQVAATTAVVVTVAARSMPFNAALVVAAVSGIAAGTVVTRRNEGGADRW